MGGIMAVVYAPLITGEEQPQWEDYATKNQDWIAESARLKETHRSHRDALHGTIQDHEHDRRHLQQEEIPPISDFIYRWESGKKVKEVGTPRQVLAPLWQGSPADSSAVNVNLFSDDRIFTLYNTVRDVKQTVLSVNTEIGEMFDWLFDPEEKPQKVLPHAFIAQPVFSDFAEEPDMVGILLGITVYTNLFDRLLPQGASGVICVVKDSCGNVMSFELNDHKAHFLGLEDVHDSAFNDYVYNFPLEISYEFGNITDSVCAHEVFVYPSNEFRSAYDSNKPIIYTSIVAASFAITVLLLIAFDKTVARRQEKTMQTAVRSDRVVSSLFPETVRDRLLQDTQHKPDKQAFQTHVQAGGKNDDSEVQNLTSAPIAELFPEVTVMVSDILLTFPILRSAMAPLIRTIPVFSLQILSASLPGPPHANRFRSFCFWKQSMEHSTR